jgi:arsenate reductase
MPTRVLFVCVHNSARSQMGEAFLRMIGGDAYEVHSAGLEPGVLNPRVVAVMKDLGIDISAAETKSVQRFLRADPPMDYVITVCDETQAERCPHFPGRVTRLHWSFPDPSSLQGSEEEKLTQTRQIRDAIAEAVQEFVER